MNFILFNGPPRSGKDTAAKIAVKHIDKLKGKVAIWEKFSFPNKRAFAGQMFAYCDKEGTVLPYEYTKEDTIPVLGVSYRQWQIDYSEKFLKPLYGEDIFGRLLLQRCQVVHAECMDQGHTPYFVVSDCGFQIECDVLRDHNVILFQMCRDDTSFAKDSRGPVCPHSSWPFYPVNNNLPILEMGAYVTWAIDKWLAR